MRAAVIPVQSLEPGFAEQHYTVPQLAEMWHMAPATTRRRFENEPGVLRLGEGRLRKGKQRSYVSLRIPASVAERVYRRLTQRGV
jgi:hypothetical protein